MKKKNVEKVRMKHLNSHLEQFISRAQALKAANKKLEEENERYLQKINEAEPDYYAMHCVEMEVRKLRDICESTSPSVGSCYFPADSQGSI